MDDSPAHVAQSDTPPSLRFSPSLFPIPKISLVVHVPHILIVSFIPKLPAADIFRMLLYALVSDFLLIFYFLPSLIFLGSHVAARPIFMLREAHRD